jgi:AraC-like DNA-binding protein
VEPTALLATAGLTLNAIEGRDARVETRAYLTVFAAAVSASRDPAFGPRVARFIDASSFGLLGFVAASCATLRDALQRFSRYSRLLCDELRFELEPRGEHVAIVYRMDAQPAVPALFEMSITHMILTARRGTGRRFTPLRVAFQHLAPPRDLSDVMHAPVTFGSTENALYCDPNALDLPLRGANSALLDVLESHVALVLERTPSSNDLVSLSRAAIQLLLPEGDPSLASVARKLGMGVRTYQRRLRDESLTFRALVDDVRYACAKEQLAHRDISIAEIAYSLGFSNPSAFHSAYRRWSGESPGRGRSPRSVSVSRTRT